MEMLNDRTGRVCIHWLVKGKPACGAYDESPRGSDDPRAATCLICEEMPAFKARVKELGGHMRIQPRISQVTVNERPRTRPADERKIVPHYRGGNPPELKTVVFHSDMGLGDACLFTGPLESLMSQYPNRFQVAVEGKYVEEVFKHNPHLSQFDQRWAHHIKFEHLHKDLMDNGSLTHQQSVCWHIGEQLGIPILSQYNRPVFYPTATEKAERLYEEPYAFISAGWKNDIPVKWYSRWQAVINQIKIFYPRVRICQVGSLRDNHPVLKGVTNLLGKWDSDAWQLIVAAYNAEFGLGGTSFLKHVFAGHGLPFVCVITGDEPVSWTWDPKTQFVGRHGVLKCCELSGCYKHKWEKCTDMRAPRVPACMDIPASEVFTQVRKIADNGTTDNLVNITLGTLYTPEMRKLGDWTSQALMNYADKHGYKYVVGKESLDESRQPSWSKIPLIANYFKEHPECDWFMWLDADAKIMNHAKRLEPLLEDVDLIIGDDKMGRDCEGQELANAGVFLIRNCSASLDYLQRVWDRPNTKPYWDGLWEQTAMREEMRKTPNFRAKIVPRRALNSFSDEYRQGDLVKHFTRGEHGRDDRAIALEMLTP